MNEGRCRERRRKKNDEDMRRMKVQECTVYKTEILVYI